MDSTIKVIEFGEVDSTNSEAMRQAGQGERGPVWLRADRQVTGRGRSGREWSSPVGNLSATLLFEPKCSFEVLHQISLVTGIAVYEAVAETFLNAGLSQPGGLRLKWPNDILIGQAKLGGILIETSVFNNEIVAAIGCGLNIAIAPEVEGRVITRLQDFGVTPTASEFLETLSGRLKHWLAVWARGERFPAIHDAWLKRAGAQGEEMSIHTAEGKMVGYFQGIDQDGALLMADHAGNVRRFQYGDVVLMRPKHGPDRTG